MCSGNSFIHFKHFYQEAEYSLSQQFPLNDDRLRYSVEPSSAQVNCATVLKSLFRLFGSDLLNENTGKCGAELCSAGKPAGQAKA